MKSIFRTYNSLQASVFDLFSGNNEVKQTLGLSYLLANDEKILFKFLNLPEIQKLNGKIKSANFSKAIIHSELYSVTGKRADIVIQLFKNGKPDTALIVEAKSASKNISSKFVVNQIMEYLKPEEFKDLIGFKTYGCALTKNDLVVQNNRITTISWGHIFELLHNQKGLAKDYLNYVTKINGSMKFYEKEVYSIPAGGSFQYQYDYPFIYECPNVGSKYTSMKKPLYLAFRKRLGIMEKIFGVDDIIIMNPKIDYVAFMNNKAYSDEVKRRVTDYCNSYWGEGNYDDNEKQFFILSTSNQIELKHHPRPLRNNAFRAYYKLSEILDPEKQIVNTE